MSVLSKARDVGDITWTPEEAKRRESAMAFVYREALNEMVEAELELEKRQADYAHAAAAYHTEPHRVQVFLNRVVEAKELLAKRVQRRDRCRKIMLGGE